MIAKLLHSKANKISLAALILGVSALLSRILGFFRDNFLANLLTKTETDIYFTAFRIPDFLYAILITGGIIAAFLPVFSETFKNNREKAWDLASNVLSVFLGFLLLISLILAIFTPLLLKVIAPGFQEVQRETAVTLTRIMFLSPVLLGISAVFSGVLRHFNLFLATALAPIFYNLGIISGIIFFKDIFGLPGLAWGVILGALLHLLVQLPALLKSGFSFKFSFDFKKPALRKIFYLMAPRTVGAAAYQINLIVITAIASTLSFGAISIFNFANNIYHIPIGLIGVSFAIAVFPFLTRSYANISLNFKRGKEQLQNKFQSTFSKILFFIVPVSFLIFLLRAHIVRVILGTSFLGEGLFGWLQTRLTAASLGVFSISLFAAALIPFLARVFFALQDTKTPVKISLIAMLLNILFCYSFVRLLSFPNFFNNFIVNLLKLEGIADIAVVGLPLGLSLATIIQFFLLTSALKERFNFKKIASSFKKILLASLLTAFLCYLFLNLSALIFNTSRVLGIFGQMIITLSLSGLSYLFLAHKFGLAEIKSILRKKNARKNT